MEAISRISRYARIAGVAAVVFVTGCEQQQGVASGGGAALTSDHVVPTGLACTPTGKHAEHGSIACSTCHQCAGTVAFDPAAAGSAAAFDATAKTCSNIACHTVPPGTFTYYVYNWGSDTYDPVTVPYGGEATGTQPYWYAPAGLGCNACHGYPPKYNGVAYTWHSGSHAYGTTNGNTCQLCHPDVTGAYVSGGPPSYAATSGGQIASCPDGTYCAAPGAITNASLHRNGTLDVTPNFTSACFGCH
jgi:hypothetical protein